MFQRLISKHIRHPHLNVLFQGYQCVCVCVCVCVMRKGGGAGKGIHLLIFHKVVWHIIKSLLATGRTSRRLGNTSTCQYVRFDMQQSHHHLQDALDVDLVTQAHVYMCVLTYKKVIISCRSDQSHHQSHHQLQFSIMCFCCQAGVQCVLQLMMTLLYVVQHPLEITRPKTKTDGDST